MRESTAKKLLKKVKNDYNQIAGEFSDTRNYQWEEFNFFKKYLYEGANILDLGCGNGRLLNFLYQNFLNSNFSYIGVDNSEKLLEEAHKKFPKAIFLPGDHLSIPLESNTIDIVFSIASFHHIPSKKLRIAALEEMKRVTKKDGKIILVVWNLWQKKYLKNIFLAIFKSILTFFNYAPNDLFISWRNKQKRYYHAFLPFEIKELLSKTNLKIVEEIPANRLEKTSFFKCRNYCLILENGN